MGPGDYQGEFSWFSLDLCSASFSCCLNLIPPSIHFPNDGLDAISSNGYRASQFTTNSKNASQENMNSEVLILQSITPCRRTSLKETIECDIKLPTTFKTNAK